MNELLAIIIIVFLCCAMFFAWLISMATCPDRMVDLISGSSSQQESSSSSSPTTSKELISGSNSPNSKRQNAADERENKPKKKYSAALLQLGAPFKQRGNTRDRELPAGSQPHMKKLSVVPEQDEQLTINSRSSQPRHSISCTQELLIEHLEKQPDSPFSMHEPETLQLVPFVAPTIIPMPVERCVEDVIDARRRQGQQQMQKEHHHWYRNDASSEVCEEDTIFLLPPRYELLHAALAGCEETRVDADAISLPNSPRSSSAGISTAVEMRLHAPLFYHNQHCHSETHIYIPPNETIVADVYEHSVPQYSGDLRHHSLSYVT